MAQAADPGRKQREFGKGFSLFTRKLMEGRRESVKDTLQIYISHLLSDEEMNAVVEETGAGVECIDFSISENLDHLEHSLKDYEKRLKRIGTEKLTLHGPFLDLNPMTFDREIQKVTEKRYAQAYKAAEYLAASKIVYHTCLYPDAYLLMGWAERTADFFGSFLEDRSTVEVVIENVFDRAWEPMAEMAERVSRANFRLCLDSFYRRNHQYCHIQHSERTFYFRSKVHMAGRINQIDLFPLIGQHSSRCSDRNSPFPLHGKEIGSSCSSINTSSLAECTAVTQKLFCQGRFTGIYMS